MVLGKVSIRLGNSNKELDHHIRPPVCPHFLSYGNMIHLSAIMIVHTVSVPMVVSTDLRVEELCDWDQTVCMGVNWYCSLSLLSVVP